MQKPKTLFIPITAQPPTFGTVMSIMSIADKFDKVIICVQDNPIILKTDIVIKMLSIVFYDSKYELITTKDDFTVLHDMPTNLPEFNYFGTLDDKIYANFIAKGFLCFMLPKSFGYEESFHRSAFKQSQELALLRTRMTLLSIKDINKKTSKPEDEDGED